MCVSVSVSVCVCVCVEGRMCVVVGSIYGEAYAPGWTGGGSARRGGRERRVSCNRGEDKEQEKREQIWVRREDGSAS